MGRWLGRIQKSEGQHPPKTPESTLGGLGGMADATFAENCIAEDPTTATEWSSWIAERCPLLPEDMTHIVRGLFRLHTRLQQRLAERYVEAWHAAADDEPKHHKRDNAGRRAANIIITQLLKGNDYV